VVVIIKLRTIDFCKNKKTRKVGGWTTGWIPRDLFY
jgi:hypothetical protein